MRTPRWLLRETAEVLSSFLALFLFGPALLAAGYFGHAPLFYLIYAIVGFGLAYTAMDMLVMPLPGLLAVFFGSVWWIAAGVYLLYLRFRRRSTPFRTLLSYSVVHEYFLLEDEYYRRLQARNAFASGGDLEDLDLM